MADVREREGNRSQYDAKLETARVGALKLIADALESYDEQDSEGFASTIEAVLENRFEPIELATEFKVSLGTISRWKSGKSCPVPYARRIIVNRLREMLSATITKRKSQIPHKEGA